MKKPMGLKEAKCDFSGDNLKVCEIDGDGEF